MSELVYLLPLLIALALLMLVATGSDLTTRERIETLSRESAHHLGGSCRPRLAGNGPLLAIAMHQS